MSVIEITFFEVAAGKRDAFQQALFSVLPILAHQPGHKGHAFGPSIENTSGVWLLVQWETLADHVEAFRGSPDFEAFVAAFRPYLSRPAHVSHMQSEGLRWR
jgi:heme-degrading monooxygenase HmoA